MFQSHISIDHQIEGLASGILPELGCCIHLFNREMNISESDAGRSNVDKKLSRTFKG